ncbi:hypothetical protein [Thiocystis violascens]|uniref:Uncharacterized protein n=1 Tax=Thiocystis violascens (strain ATCC 17096 / DSM 198 / 6111) TaxID=765911 RepID=I3YGU6_THIV6|nr:hypothetical protein [Thiocystis violascens]AFL76214.1 hypothetical protein Thivi_4411 [Thiocystis violascens DSM 198]
MTNHSLQLAHAAADNAVARARHEVAQLRDRLTAAQRRLRAAERTRDAARLNWLAVRDAYPTWAVADPVGTIDAAPSGAVQLTPRTNTAWEGASCN